MHDRLGCAGRPEDCIGVNIPAKAFASLLTSPALALPQWTAVISLLMLLKLQQVYQHHQDSQVQALP